MAAAAVSGAPRAQHLTAQSAGVSLNGWAGLTYSRDHHLAQVQVPATRHTVRLRKEVLPVFLNLLAHLDREVLRLDPGPLDSWEYRSARGGTVLSNHASGTAVDFRVDLFPPDGQRHLTPGQREKLEQLLERYRTPDGHRLIAWGGERPVGRGCDEGHLEVGQARQVGRTITPADFERFTRAQRLRPNGTQALAAVPAAAPAPAPGSKVHLHLLRPGLSNLDVKSLQLALKRRGFDAGTSSGTFDPATVAAVQAVQRHLGFTGFDADGVPGKRSLSFLGLSQAP